MVADQFTWSGPGSGGRFDLFLDAGGLAPAFPHVIKLGTADITAPFDLDIGNGRAVGLEDTFNTFTIGELAHGK